MSALRNITVLVAEDSGPMKGLVTSVLEGLGVGRVLQADSGADAIAMLRAVREDPYSIGTGSVDLILADWIMSPGDGADLLRWVRHDSASPDRFTPFMMLTAFAEEDRVAVARDLGVTDFLVKPFSVHALAAHLQAIVRDERRYIAAPTFFGPDRRRRDRSYAGAERRHLDPEAPGTAAVRMLPVPRPLRAKIGGAVPFEWSSLRRIQAATEAPESGFPDRAGLLLLALDNEVADALGRPAADRRRNYARMRLLSHELRGQGGTFGFPLVSVFAKSLFALTGDKMDATDDALFLVQRHVDALKHVLRAGIRDDGGEVGRELASAMALATRKFQERAQRLHETQTGALRAG